MKKIIFNIIVSFVFLTAVSAEASTFKLKDKGNKMVTRSGGATLQEGCSDICQGNLCQNGSTCSAGGGNPTQNSSSACFGKTYKCSCAGGYAGSYCQTYCQSPCASSMCAAGSTCVVGGSLVNLLVDAACPSRTFSCTCPSLDATTGYAYDTTCNKTCSGTVLSSTCCVNSSMTDASCLTALCSSACGSDYGSTADTAKCLQAGAVGSAANNASSSLVSFDGKYYAKTDVSASGRSMQCLQDDVTGCAGWLAANEPSAGVATDQESLISELASKSIVVVTEDFDLTSGITLASGKVLRGAKYYETASSGKCSENVKITVKEKTASAITLNGATLENLHVYYSGGFDRIAAAAIQGSGSISNLTLEARNPGSPTYSLLRAGIEATGNMVLSNIKIISDPVAQGKYRTDPYYGFLNAGISITAGKTTLNGTLDCQGVMPSCINGAKGTGTPEFQSAASSIITVSAQTYRGLYFTAGTATFGGTVKMTIPSDHVAVEGSSYGTVTTIYLNGNGNVLKAKGSCIYSTSAATTIEINGSTSIDMDLRDVYVYTVGGSYAALGAISGKFVVNAPVAVSGYVPTSTPAGKDETTISAIYASGPVTVNAPITKSSSVATYVRFMGETLVIGKKGSQSGYLDVTAMSGYGGGTNKIQASAAGLKMRIGGVCKSNASAGTYTFPGSKMSVSTTLNSPPSPFTTAATCP